MNIKQELDWIMIGIIIVIIFILLLNWLLVLCLMWIK